MYTWKQNTWRMFHLITRNYDSTYNDKYKDFFDSFKVIIPCGICRRHYTQQIEPVERHVENNYDRIFDWTIDIHNNVNRMHHVRLWNYNEASKFYGSVGLAFDTVKMFLYEYILLNFRKNGEKTDNLIKMIVSLAYIFPNTRKRDKLIDYVNTFPLNKDNFKKWLIGYLTIIKSY